MAQDINSILEYVKIRMGEGVVAVELTDGQIMLAIEDAKMWYCTYMSQLRSYVTVIPATNQLTMDEECDLVVDVIFENNQAIDIFKWAGVEFNLYDPLHSSGNDSLYSDYVQNLQYWETGRRIFSSDDDWDYEEYYKKLRFFPTNNYRSGSNVMIVYQVGAEYLDILKMRTKEYNLLRQYSYAQAMETLGWIRTKYSELPSATGSLNLNGDTLLVNSETLKITLSEQIQKIREPIGFLVR